MLAACVRRYAHAHWNKCENLLKIEFVLGIAHWFGARLVATTTSISSNEAKPGTNIEKKKIIDEIDHVARTPMTIHSIHLCVQSSRHFGLGNTFFNQIK